MEAPTGPEASVPPQKSHEASSASSDNVARQESISLTLNNPERDLEAPEARASINGEKDLVPPTRMSQQENEDSAPAASMSALQTVILTLALCLCVFLAALDVTIITTALPTIAEHFENVAGYTWVGAAYTLSEAASTPIWGKLSDIWGRKPLLQLAIAVFFVGSLLSALSVNIGMLIVGRAVQGVGGGGLLTIVSIVIGDLFSMRDRGKYYGFVGMTWAVAASTGPVIGGVLTEKVSWRWCFYINLPIISTVFVIILLFLKLETPKTPMWAGLKAVDWLGSLSIIGATVIFLLGLEFGGIIHPWKSANVICLVVFGIVAAGIFLMIEWKIARHPIMPLRLYNSISNSASLLACFIHGMTFVAGTFYLPLYFQGVLGASALLSGVWLLPFSGGIAFSASITGMYVKMTGRYLETIWFGFVLMTLGFGLLISLDATANWPKIIIYQFIAGLGVGPNFQAVLIALQNGVSAHDLATATALFGFVRNLASSIGVVIGGVIFQNGIQSHATELRDSLGSAAQLILGGAATANTRIVDELPEPQRLVTRNVYHISLRSVWIFAVSISTVGLLAILAIRKSKLSTERHVVKTGLDAEEERRRTFLAKKNEEI